MNTREIASGYRMSHWAGVLQERSASGQSIKEYCKTAGIAENVYYYWQRKLRTAACEELAIRTGHPAAASDPSIVPRGWAVCKTAEPAGKTLEVEINGCRVRVEADADPEQLAKVFRVLKSLC